MKDERKKEKRSCWACATGWGCGFGNTEAKRKKVRPQMKEKGKKFKKNDFRVHGQTEQRLLFRVPVGIGRAKVKT